jgi:diphosphomevalonate decarboxylase
MSSARSVACSNIALVKYWGKADKAQNLPAVPSLSLTLDALTTTTTVDFDPALRMDTMVLNGADAPSEAVARATKLLDRVRVAARLTARARIVTANDFPTASGLASSASGFAALAAAASIAAGLPANPAAFSDLARRSSASAARSIFGGFATLAAGGPGTDFLAAEPLLDRGAWDVCIVVAVTTEHAKDIGSTDAMQRTAATSPYYAAWLDAAPKLFAQARRAVQERDLEALGDATEKSTMAMHASAIAASPSVLYWQPPTLLVLAAVQKLRKGGIACFATMDAGPHVKVLAARADAARIQHALDEVPGVVRTLVALPGPGTHAELVDPERLRSVHHPGKGQS